MKLINTAHHTVMNKQPFTLCKLLQIQFAVSPLVKAGWFDFSHLFSLFKNKFQCNISHTHTHHRHTLSYNNYLYYKILKALLHSLLKQMEVTALLYGTLSTIFVKPYWGSNWQPASHSPNMVCLVWINSLIFQEVPMRASYSFPDLSSFWHSK